MNCAAPVALAGVKVAVRVTAWPDVDVDGLATNVIAGVTFVTIN